MLKHFCIKTVTQTFEIGNKHILIHKRFAGHSKWANIRHIKGAKDAERSKLFAKMGRQIKVAVTEGGSTDPKKNLQLSQIIDQTRRANMPIATLQSILKACENDKSQCKRHMLEIKSKWSDGGGLHMFEEKGQIDAEHPSLTDKKENEILELATEHAIESGAEDVKILDNNMVQFSCGKTNLSKVVAELEKIGYKVTNAEAEYVPIKLQTLQDADLEICKNLYEKLENMPEVINMADNIA